MARRVWIWSVAPVAVALAAGCGNHGAADQREHAGPPVTRAPAADIAARCAEYQGFLRGLASGPPAAYAAETILLTHMLDPSPPPAAANRPIPSDDWHWASGAVVLSAEVPSPPLPPFDGPPFDQARVYVRADPTLPVSRLAALRAGAPATAELRLLVAKPDDQLRAELRALLPHTPAGLALELPSTLDDRKGAALAAMGRPCAALSRVFDLFRGNAMSTVVGPTLADALATCDCHLTDLDGFVSLMMWMVLAKPEVGWLPLDAATLSAAPPAETIGDFASKAARR